MVNEVKDIKVEHVLIVIIVVFVLYHFIGRCQCDGFSVGIGTSASCTAELTKICSVAKKKGQKQCAVYCAGQHQGQLRAAGCYESDIESFCDT